MARTRNIKEGFSTNEQLAELGPMAHLLFAALWPHCDREGRMEDRAKRIKVRCLPFYECNVDELLEALAGGPEPFIIRYEIDGKKYLQVINWHTHQKPYTREPESVIPAYKPKSCKSTAKSVRASCSGTKARNRKEMGTEMGTGEGGCKGETPSVDAASTPPVQPKSSEPFDVWWSAVPNRVGRGEASTAYAKAVKAIRGRAGLGGEDPHCFLLERIRAFAVTPKARGDFCPHPATWLNQGRYDDDPKVWQNAGGNRNGRRNDIGPGQRHDPATAKSAPVEGW